MYLYVLTDNGSDAANLTLSAKEDGDHFVLNGSKVITMVIAQTRGNLGKLLILLLPGLLSDLEIS